MKAPKTVGRILTALRSFLGKVGSLLSAAARQAVRFFLFPAAHRRRKHPERAKDGLVAKLISWSEEWEPDDPQERWILFRVRWYGLVTFLWIAALSALMVLLFGNPIPRAGASFSYMFESWKYIFLSLAAGEGEEIPPPTTSNETSADYGWVLSTVKSLWFYVQAGINGMANPYVAREWAIQLSNKLIDFVKFATWVPIGIIGFKLFASILVSPHKNDDGEATLALRVWDEKIVPRFLRPIRDTFLDYREWLSANSGFVKKTVLVISMVLCVYGWTLLDFVTSYFTMLMTFTFGWFPAFFSSAVVDAVNVFSRIGLPGFVLIGAQVSYMANVKIALGDLRSMQANNEDVAKSLPVVTAVNGPVGVGKTTMVSSIAVDGEAHFRDHYLGVMTKYASAFPKFDWERLEGWVRAKCRPEASGERLETRAKVKEGLKAAWDLWIDGGMAPELQNGNEAFFGYDPGNGLRFFDGAKEISLIDGVLAYAESYFMYFSGKKLVTSNYPIALDGGRFGEFFPIYPAASAYLSGRCRPPRGIKAYSTIFNEDFFRIKMAVDPGDRSKDASIDGGVIAMTEGSNERGNKNDYANMSRKDETANKVNDGWNQAMRLIRHWFTVDGTPVCCFIYDYQRGGAMNADQREAAEDTIFIMERSEEQNALPAWWFLDYVTEWFAAKWENYYWYSWRPNRSKKTLLNRFLGRICGYFINLRQRLRFSYGYQIAAFNREHGGGNGLVGQRTNEQYFFIFRKVRGELFASDVYAPILEQRSISAKSGWLDMPTFTSVEATPEEFDRENSFFIRDISSLFDPRAAGKASARIRRAASDGTSIPDEEEDEGGGEGGVETPSEERPEDVPEAPEEK